MLCPEAAQVHVRRALEVRMRLTFGEDLRLHNGKAVDLCLHLSINGGGAFIRRIRLVSGNSAQQALVRRLGAGASLLLERTHDGELLLFRRHEGHL